MHILHRSFIKAILKAFQSYVGANRQYSFHQIFIRATLKLSVGTLGFYLSILLRLIFCLRANVARTTLQRYATIYVYNNLVYK